MKAGQDVRPDMQRTGSDAHPNPPTNSEPRAAEGGVGTGTKTDPAKDKSNDSTAPLPPPKP